MKIYITYETPVYVGHKSDILKYNGPYLKVFDNEDEALRWIRINDIQITCIDRL